MGTPAGSFSYPKRLSSSASTSGEMACSIRSASSCAFAQEQADHFGQQHLRELMPQREMFRMFAALLRQVDPSAAFHAHVAVARHALQCSSRARSRRIESNSSSGGLLH